MTLAADELRIQVVQSLEEQGFQILNGQMLPPTDLSKDALRKLHSSAVQHRIQRSSLSLRSREQRLLTHFAAGNEVVPECIAPRLVEVQADTEEELLFRYASLHWSIPLSSGYGRRLRFIVVDDANGKVMGLFALGDPVFNLGARDSWIGWDRETRRVRLQHVLDAFVVGAVPPYSFLLGGKLIGMLATSDEVREAFTRRYSQRVSFIRSENLDPRLALITTTSALGRSSLYNRLRYRERVLYQPVGFTRGSGEFHFANGLYATLAGYAAEHCAPTAKHGRWGIGFRNRREVVKKALAALGLSTTWLYHGVQREVFLAPLARNVPEFLRREEDELEWYHQPVKDLFGFFRERWLLPRSQRDQRYKAWDPQTWVLWPRERSQ